MKRCIRCPPSAAMPWVKPKSLALENNLNFPQAHKTRWQPLRAGLVDLFYYDYQEFWFRDGRLLLRGNNGTGKSKVLALTLPFLLDGRALPSRVEPDGDVQKRMEWNLLMGNRYTERTGYSWLEFGRLRQDGTTETFTIGCGMKAVKGRPLTTWFFTTDLRMARDFSLLDNNRRTLSKERLREILGEHAVIDQASRYRKVVDEKLFQLGEERYEALISLLIQLRQPQLSKRPDEKALSKALTEALPPLDSGMLGDIAEAFRNLEAERQELTGLRETARAVDEFRRHYRQYARVAGRRRAAIVRRAQSRYEKVSADLNQAKAAHQRGQQGEQGILTEIEAMKTALQAERVRERTLQQSPEMRDAHTLHLAEERAKEKESHVFAMKAEAQAMAYAVAEAQRRAEEHDTQVAQVKAEITHSSTRLAALAVKLRIDKPHQGLTAPLQLPEGGETPCSSDSRISDAESVIKTLYHRRKEQISHIKALNKVFDQVAALHQRAQERWQEARDQLEGLTEAQLEAETEADIAARALVAAFLHYCRGLYALRLTDPDTVVELLRAWTISLEGSNPASEAMTIAFETASHQWASEKTQISYQYEKQQTVLDALNEEKLRLEAGEEQQPPPPYTRPEGLRRERSGAPLWKLIDFHENISHDLQATVEAALEASGLLDAWVLPEGKLLDKQTWDVVFTPGPPAPQGLGHILKAQVNRADPQAHGVTDAVLNDLLAAIGWGKSNHPTWIDDRGQWRLGPLEGSWGKSEAEYIGQGSREAARLRRLEALAVEIIQLETIVEGLKQQGNNLEERKVLLDTNGKQRRMMNLCGRPIDRSQR